jgi:hypothetical protein
VAEPKQTVATFTFTHEGDGSIAIDPGGERPDMEQTWALWMACMHTLIQAPALPPARKKLLKRVLGHALGTAGAIVDSLRIVTIFHNADGSFVGIEYRSDEFGSLATGWNRRGTYQEVIDKIREAFGSLTRIPRDVEDVPEVYENWI